MWGERWHGHSARDQCVVGGDRRRGEVVTSTHSTAAPAAGDWSSAQRMASHTHQPQPSTLLLLHNRNSSNVVGVKSQMGLYS